VKRFWKRLVGKLLRAWWRAAMAFLAVLWRRRRRLQ